MAVWIQSPTHLFRLPGFAVAPRSRSRSDALQGRPKPLLATLAFVAVVGGLGAPALSGESISFDGTWSKSWNLASGQTVQIQVGVAQPSSLPDNARIEVRWQGPSGDATYRGDRGDLVVGTENGWSKALHALDPDVFLTYKAPQSGRYDLFLETVVGGKSRLSEYHRDTGLAHLASARPANTRPVRQTEVRVDVRDSPETQGGDVVVETEPNDAPEQAIDLPFAPGAANQVLRIVGGADELEYFDNPDSGKSPDDWYRFIYRGDRVKLLTANLQMPDPVVSARIRVYRPGVPTAEELKPREAAQRSDFGNNSIIPYIISGHRGDPGARTGVHLLRRARPQRANSPARRQLPLVRDPAGSSRRHLLPPSGGESTRIRT